MTEGAKKAMLVSIVNKLGDLWFFNELFKKPGTNETTIDMFMYGCKYIPLLRRLVMQYYQQGTYLWDGI